MAVYDLKNPKDLKHDFDYILSRLNSLYTIDMADGQIILLPKLIDNSDAFWASEENTEAFNSHVPTFKSLHLDMYSFIEATIRQKSSKYEYKQFEQKYPDFKEFRLLNNMIKHPKEKEVVIDFTKIVHLEPKKFDLLCNFKYKDSFKCLLYSAFIILFLKILNDMKIIQLEK